MDQALRPSHLPSDPILSEQADELEPLKEEENSLAFVGRSAGWRLILKEMDQIEEELDQLAISSMADSNFEELGKRVLVKELVKNALKRIKTKVEDAREASDRRTS